MVDRATRATARYYGTDNKRWSRPDRAQQSRQRRALCAPCSPPHHLLAWSEDDLALSSSTGCSYRLALGIIDPKITHCHVLHGSTPSRHVPDRVRCFMIGILARDYLPAPDYRGVWLWYFNSNIVNQSSYPLPSSLTRPTSYPGFSASQLATTLLIKDVLQPCKDYDPRGQKLGYNFVHQTSDNFYMEVSPSPGLFISRKISVRQVHWLFCCRGARVGSGGL